jgi:hypothetical protein
VEVVQEGRHGSSRSSVMAPGTPAAHPDPATSQQQQQQQQQPGGGREGNWPAGAAAAAAGGPSPGPSRPLAGVVSAPADTMVGRVGASSSGPPTAQAYQKFASASALQSPFASSYDWGALAAAAPGAAGAGAGGSRSGQLFDQQSQLSVPSSPFVSGYDIGALKDAAPQVVPLSSRGSRGSKRQRLRQLLERHIWAAPAPPEQQQQAAAAEAGVSRKQLTSPFAVSYNPAVLWSAASGAAAAAAGGGTGGGSSSSHASPPKHPQQQQQQHKSVPLPPSPFAGAYDLRALRDAVPAGSALLYESLQPQQPSVLPDSSSGGGSSSRDTGSSGRPGTPVQAAGLWQTPGSGSTVQGRSE